MERLPWAGVPNATNAFAVSDDARMAYFHDPKADVVVAIDVSPGGGGERRIIKWDDKNFAHRRWVCYSLFAWKKSGMQDEFLSILFFNQHKKVFCLVHFCVQGELLVKVQTNALNTSTINKERLAYSVSKDGGELQIVFYERFSSASSPSFSAIPPPRLRFIFCSFSCATMRVTTNNGLLPTSGQWELPFVSRQSLHFISTANTPHLFISYPRTENACWESVVPQPSGILSPDSFPPRKALWCNAWSRGIGWFAVTEKVESEEGSISRKTTLWRLDVNNEWKWRRHAATLDTPEYTKSFALRLTPPPLMPSGAGITSPYCWAFLHADWQHSEAAIFRVKLDVPSQILQRRISESVAYDHDDSTSTDSRMSEDEEEERDEEDGLHLQRSTHSGRYAKSPPRESLTDLMCPICLDTYEDARTLTCGHSMCWECIEQMRISVKSETIRCPNCRAPTTIPPGGLPINYGLKDAIAALSRLVVTRRGCLRCVGCRDKTESTKMWLCITCCRHAASETRTSVRRPTSLYLPTSGDNLPTMTSPGARSGEKPIIGGPSSPTKFTSAPGPSSTSAISAPGPFVQDSRLIQAAYCAACLLNNHAGHEYEGLGKMRERAASLARKREEYGRRAGAAVNAMREATVQVLDAKICQPLLSMVGGKLDSLADIVKVSEDADMQRRSEAVIIRLEEICAQFGAEASVLLEDLLESCSTRQERGIEAHSNGDRSSRSSGHVTEL